MVRVFQVLILLITLVWLTGCSMKAQVDAMNSQLAKGEVKTHEVLEKSGNKVILKMTGDCTSYVADMQISISGQSLTQAKTEADLLANTNQFYFKCDTKTGKLDLQYNVPDPNTARNIKFDVSFLTDDKDRFSNTYKLDYERPPVPPLVINTSFKPLFTTNNTLPTITGSCTTDRIEGGSYRIDGGAWSSNTVIPCVGDSWSWSPPSAFTGSPPTTYTIEFRAYNSLVGTLYSEITSLQIHTDTVASATGPTILGLQSDSVDTVTDAYLGVGLPNIFWSADASANTHEISLKSLDDVTTFCGPVTVAATLSNYQMLAADCALPFVDGTQYRVRMSSIDLAGNPSTTTSTLTFHADYTAPTFTITAQPSNPTFDQFANFTFTVNSPVGSPLQPASECKLDTLSWASCSGGVNYTGLTFNANHTLAIRHTDNAGNVGTTSYTWTINEDVTDPVCTPTWPDWNWTNSDSRTLTFNCTDNDVVAAVECRLNNTSWIPCTTTTTNALTALNSQQHILEVRARDNYNNYSAVISETWDVDLENPSLSMNVTPLDPTLVDNVTFQFTESDPAPHPSGVATVECQIDGGAFAICTNNPTFTSQAKGPHQLVVRLTDVAGNVYTSGAFNFNIGAAGYYNCASGTCQPAGAGYYAPAGTDDNRYACGTGTYTDTATAGSCLACTNMPANATSVTYAVSSAVSSNNCPIASVDSCLAGWTPNGTVCRLACDIGLYWDGASCTDVGIGFYSPTLDDNRYACPANSTTTGINSGSINDCLGNAGYYDCQSGACSAVGTAYYSPVNDNARYACPNNRHTSAPTAGAAHADCLADLGYYGADTSIDAVAVGLNYYSPALDNARYACPANRSTSGTTSGSDADCLADAGYYGLVTSIASVDVGPGYWSPTLDNLRYQCAAGRYGSTNNNTTDQCDGPCNAGFYCLAGSTTANGNGACPAGLYCPTETGTPSLVCDVDTYSTGGAAASTCTACPTNSQAPGVLQSEHDSINDCLGNAGYYNCQSGTCSVVGVGYYSPTLDNNRYVCGANTYSNTTTAGSCVSCPANSQTYGVLDFNHDDIDDCLGDAGYYNCQSGFCLTAGAGYYSPNADNTRYTCGTGTYSPTATESSCTACTNMPANATAVTYAASSALTSNTCPIASVDACSFGWDPSGVVCVDSTPDAITFTDQTGLNLTTTATSNAVVLSGFAGPVTATCNAGCTAIARNGVWGGASVSGFMPGDTIEIRQTSSGTFLTNTTASVDVGDYTSSTWTVQTRPGNDCTGTPWGTIAHNSSVTAYSDITPTPPATCASVSEVRSCWDGTLSNSFTGTTCNEGCSGTPWGNVEHGYSNTAYTSATPASTCAAASAVRTCANGTMNNPAYTSASCSEGCVGTPFGNLSHGWSTTVYASSSPVGACSSGTASCNNGTYSNPVGTTITSCNNGCEGTYTHGQSMGTRYTTATPTSACSGAAITCNNGSPSPGGYPATSCTDGCEGAYIHGQAMGTRYTTSSPTGACSGAAITCNAGSPSPGGYPATSCNAGCEGTYTHGQSMGTRYTTSLPTSSCAAASAAITCSNGSPSPGGYPATSCTSGCEGAYTHGQSMGTRYPTATPTGACAPAAVTCNAGTPSPNYTVTSCNAGCEGTYTHGQSMGTRYTTSSPTGACSGAGITCNNGSPSPGGYPATSCNAGCEGTYTHGQSMGTRYTSASPAGPCSGAAITCSNGSASPGGYPATSCNAGCTGTPWGNVTHGYSNTAYYYAAVNNPDLCGNYTAVRTCTNGSMSNAAYLYASCDQHCAVGTGGGCSYWSSGCGGSSNSGANEAYTEWGFNAVWCTWAWQTGVCGSFFNNAGPDTIGGNDDDSWFVQCSWNDWVNGTIQCSGACM